MNDWPTHNLKSRDASASKKSIYLDHPTKTKKNHNKLILMLLNLTISFRDGKNSQKIVTGASIRNRCKASIYLFFKEGNFRPFTHNVSSINAWEWTFIFPGGVWASPRPSGGGRQRLGDIVPLAAGRGEEKEHISTVRHQRHNKTLQFYSIFGLKMEVYFYTAS